MSDGSQTHHPHICWQSQNVQRRATQSAAEQPSSLSTQVMRPADSNDVLLPSSRLMNLANNADECHQNTAARTDTLSGSILTCGSKRLWLVLSYTLRRSLLKSRRRRLLRLELVWLATFRLVLIIRRPPITSRHSIIRWRTLLVACIYCFPPGLEGLNVCQRVTKIAGAIKVLFCDTLHETVHVIWSTNNVQSSQSSLCSLRGQCQIFR